MRPRQAVLPELPSDGPSLHAPCQPLAIQCRPARWHWVGRPGCAGWSWKPGAGSRLQGYHYAGRKRGRDLVLQAPLQHAQQTARLQHRPLGVRCRQHAPGRGRRAALALRPAVRRLHCPAQAGPCRHWGRQGQQPWRAALGAGCCGRSGRLWWPRRPPLWAHLRLRRGAFGRGACCRRCSNLWHRRRLSPPPPPPLCPPLPQPPVASCPGRQVLLHCGTGCDRPPGRHARRQHLGKACPPGAA